MQKSDSRPVALYIIADVLQRKTDWPCRTVSHHMINIYLCPQVKWKKRQSSANVSALLLVFITKWDEKEKGGGWQQSGALNMNKVTHT